MLSIANCELPSTGSSLSIFLGVVMCLIAGLVIAGITRRSASRLSAVALVPALMLAFSVLPRATNQDCVTDTTEAATRESTTTVAPSTTVAPTTTVPATTTTLPRISLSVSAGGIINSISADDPLPTAITPNSWTGTIGGSNTSFTVTGDFVAVGTVTGATCGTVSGTTPATITCTITATTVSLTLFSAV